MRGRKPKLDEKVVQFPGAAGDSWHAEQALRFRPRGLSRPERAEWARVAEELSRVGRLHARFQDVIREYVQLVVRIRETRSWLASNGETYESEGRQGIQFKSRPEVAQLNDDWRKWRSLMAELGLSPAAERGLQSGQMDLFDNPFAALDHDVG